MNHNLRNKSDILKLDAFLINYRQREMLFDCTDETLSGGWLTQPIIPYYLGNRIR